MGPYGPIPDYTGPYRIIPDHMGPYKTIQPYIHTGPWTLWDHIGPYRTKQDHTGPYRDVWDNTGATGPYEALTTMQGHMGP